MSQERTCLTWHKSTASASGNCVEVAQSDHEILVRDSKEPTGPVLRFTRSEWAAFLTGVTAGEFGAVSPPQ